MTLLTREGEALQVDGQLVSSRSSADGRLETSLAGGAVRVCFGLMGYKSGVRTRACCFSCAVSLLASADQET